MDDLEFIKQWRQSLLMLVDNLESKMQSLGFAMTRTSELRDEVKRLRSQVKQLQLELNRAAKRDTIPL